MGATNRKIETNYLRLLVPMNDLTQENLTELASKTFIQELPQGKALFKKGEVDNRTIYLITGALTLTYGVDEEDKTLVGGTAKSRFPIDHHKPRQATAIAKTPITYIEIDNDFLDLLLTWDQNAGYMVTEIEVEDEVPAEDDTDWMTHMLRSKLFQRIPPTNIQAVFIHLEGVPVRKGEQVITQGEDGDFYYYIKEGKALVSHESPKTGKVIKLAELEAGQSFGEEALISNAKRNATVTMLTDGMLMRLGKEPFEQLLKSPILQSVAYDEAQRMAAEENAVFLDVRLETEHKNSAIADSVNIPFYLLRIKAKELDKSKKYIVYCDTGRRSSSAAFLLSERGFDAYVLEGGLMAIPREQQPEEQNNGE